MSLRRKTLLVTSVIVFGLVVLLYAVSQVILLQSFSLLEEQNTQRNLERVLNTLSDELTSLSATTADWAHWDDTYAFAQDGNEDYIAANLFDEAATNLNLNVMIFANTEGQIVFSKAVDLESGTEIPFPPDLNQHLSGNTPLLLHTNETSAVTGIVVVSDVPMLISSRPILTSQKEGPIQGSLVFGRFLNDTQIELLSETLRLSLSIYPTRSSTLPEDFSFARATLSPQAPTYIRPLNSDLVAGYALLQDIYGAPALLLRVAIPRDIYGQGLASLSYFLMSLLLIGLMFALVNLAFLDKAILSRLTKLSAGVSTVRSSGDLSTRVKIAGADELANLANGFNEMMIALSQSRSELQRAHDELGQRVQERTLQLSEANTLLKQEVAERKQAQDELAVARDQALDALRLKTQILANVSHDARTPLTIITLQVEMLLMERHGSLTEKQRELLDGIVSSARQLLGFVNNLLNEAQIQANKVALKNVEFALADLVDETCAAMTPLAERKGLEFRLEVASNMPQKLSNDPDRLRQIIFNLVGNAIKFTERGTVWVRVLKPDETHWAVQVSDSGRGIPLDAQSHIFTAFWQVDGSITREANRGVGLGLSIVKQLTTLMNGQISVQSEVGLGSTFTVTLPLALEQAEKTYA